jgi:hypothetical protein
VLQAEFSLTQVLDKPVTGRIFFGQVIRDNLDIGRPDRTGLIFGRRIIRKGPRATPGQFRTRILTEGVVPTLHIDYKHSKIKQYHKEGKALRTGTTINDASRPSASATPALMPCSRRCASSGFFPAASPTATCGPSWPSSSAFPPSPSPRGR